MPRNLKKIAITPTSSKVKRIYWTISIIGIFVGIVCFFFFVVKSSNKNTQKSNPQQNPPSEEEIKNCPYLNENDQVIAELRARERSHNYPNKELAKLRQIPPRFIVKCYQKGYHWWDIIQLWDWQLSQEEIPDLNSQNRIGVMNELAVMFNWKKKEGESYYIGLVHDLVVIRRKIPGNGPLITIDHKLTQDLPMSKNSGNKMKKYLERVVNFLGDQQDINLSQCKFFILNPIRAERFGKEETIAYGRIGGKSGGISLYLALLSACYEKPISRQVAATGALLVSKKGKKRGKVNNQEISLVPGTTLNIMGLIKRKSGSLCGKRSQPINSFEISIFTQPIIAILSAKMTRGLHWR